LGIGKTRRERRRELKAAIRRITAVLIVGAVIVGAMYGYTYLTTSESFSVTAVEFDGLSRVQDGSLERVLADLVGSNLFLAPLESYEARLEMHPRVASARLRRVLPDRVVCSVEEREPVALVFTDRYLEVADDAMVMEDDEYTALLDLPVITGLSSGEAIPGEISDSPRLRRALDALRLCREHGGNFAATISEVSVGNEGVSILSLERGPVLVLGEGDYERRLRKYFMLKDTIGTRDGDVRRIDLRFEDQVVLRGRI
jgi:cell division septal protein FtsQ